MSEYYVYEWVRLDTNEPFYIGKGKGNRWHLMHGRNRYFQNIINKVGIENIAVVLLHRDLTEHEAFLMEKFYIHYYKNSLGFSLSNITDGGDGISGYIMTPENRKKMSENNARFWKGKKMPESAVQKMKENNYWRGKNLPKEIREKISTSRRGKYTGSQNHNFGKPMSEEIKQKQRESRLGEKSIWYNVRGSDHPAHGYQHTEEARRKISEAGKGRKKSEAVMEKLRDRHGEKNPMYGKTHTPEARKSMGEKRSGSNNWMSVGIKIINFETNEELNFPTMTQASKHLKSCSATLNKYIKSGKLFRNMYKIESI